MKIKYPTKRQLQKLHKTDGVYDVLDYIKSMRLFEAYVRGINPALCAEAWGALK